VSRLLLGPILRELERILPHDGLRHSLGRLAQQLRRLHTAPSAGVEALPLPEAIVYFDKPTLTLPKALPAASEAALEHFVRAFARLDHVRQVAVLRQGGEVILARGEGVELATLARLGLLGLKAALAQWPAAHLLSGAQLRAAFCFRSALIQW
jgi:hypothetical protein